MRAGVGATIDVELGGHTDETMGKPVKAFIYQDHDSHIAVHTSALHDPHMQQMLQQNPQAQALMAGRNFVTPDDIKGLAQPVLAHRLLVRHGQGRDHGHIAGEALRQILDKTPVPS